VADTSSIENLIRSMGESEAAAREAAARAIFKRGRELAHPAIEIWLADAEMKRLFALDDYGNVVTTAGIAVHPANFERLRIVNGSPRLADVPPDQDAKEFELHFGREIRLDILTTRDPGGTGAIARFLNKSGEGIQQVELTVRDVDRATEILRERFGQSAVYPETRAGADGTRVNFFLVTTPQPKKVLIEFVEERKNSS
jgi:hypothetical protein